MSFVLFLLTVAVLWLFFSLRAAKQQAHFDRRRLDALEYDVRELYTNWAGRVKRLEDEISLLRARLSGVERAGTETAAEAESASEPPAPAAAVTTPPAKFPSKIPAADRATTRPTPPPAPAEPSETATSRRSTCRCSTRAPAAPSRDPPFTGSPAAATPDLPSAPRGPTAGRAPRHQLGTVARYSRRRRVGRHRYGARRRAVPQVFDRAGTNSADRSRRDRVPDGSGVFVRRREDARARLWSDRERFVGRGHHHSLCLGLGGARSL